MDSVSAGQLLQRIAGQAYDPAQMILSQVSRFFVPVPRSHELIPASSWKGLVYGRCYSWLGRRESEVQRRIERAWQLAKQERLLQGLELSFRERLTGELEPLEPPSLNPSLESLRQFRIKAQESTEANPFPKSVLRNLKSPFYSELEREQLQEALEDFYEREQVRFAAEELASLSKEELLARLISLAGCPTRLARAFRPVDEELEVFERYLEQNPDLANKRLNHSQYSVLIRNGTQLYGQWQEQLCAARDPALRQQIMGTIAQWCCQKLIDLNEEERWLFCGEYGVRATGFGVARYVLKQVSADKVPDWLKPFLQKGDLPNPQALLEGIVYKVIQQALDQFSKAIGVVFEDLNLDRSAVAQVTLPDPNEYVEGLLHRAFDALRSFSDSLQLPSSVLNDLRLLFPDSDRAAPDWISKLLPARLEMQLQKAVEEGLLGDLAALFPAGAIKNLLELVVRSAYLIEKRESRREFLTEVEQELARHIQLSLGSGLDFLDGRLDDLIASAAETLPPDLLSWADLDLIGFGAPCWLEFERTGDDSYDVTIYPLGIALNHPWHERDQVTGEVKWPLHIQSVSRNKLTQEFFYKLLFHTFEPQCDSQVTLKASEFYDHLCKLGLPFSTTSAVLDRRRNDKGYLVQAILTDPSQKPEKIELDRHLQDIYRTCRALWSLEKSTIVVNDLQVAEVLSTSIAQMNAEAKKLFKKRLISHTYCEQIAEARQEIAAAIQDCHKRCVQYSGMLERARAKVHQLQQEGVSSLQGAREWLAWALGDEVDALIEALAAAMPPTDARPYKERDKGWLRQLGGWELVQVLSHCLTILESLRSKLAPLHAIKLAHGALGYLAPKVVNEWYHSLLRLLAQKLSDLFVYVILSCFSARLDLDRFKRFAEAGKGLVNRLAQEAKNARTICLECKPPLFDQAPKIQLAGPFLLPSDRVEKPIPTPQLYAPSSAIDPITDAPALHNALLRWREEDKHTSLADGMKPFIYQRTLARISSLPVPLKEGDPTWDSIDNPTEVLYAISKIGRVLHDTYQERAHRADEHILAHYQVLFTVEKLMARQHPLLLHGFTVNACNFLRYAKGAVTGFSPELEERFYRLVAYRFPHLKIAELPDEEEIGRLVEGALFARRGSQPTMLSKYIDWYVEQAKTDEAIRRQLESAVPADLCERWNAHPQYWVQYLKRQVNDTYNVEGGFPLAFRLLRMHSLFAHYAVAGVAWQPQDTSGEWHATIVRENDAQNYGAFAMLLNWVAKIKEPVQPETEEPLKGMSQNLGLRSRKLKHTSLGPEYGKLETWLDPSVIRLQVERRKESAILSAGPSKHYFDEDVPATVLSDFETIFCEARNQLQRALVFLDKHPKGIWENDPCRMTDFLYATLFQAGRLQEELRSAPELPKQINKVVGRLFHYYLQSDPAICLSLAYIAIQAGQACQTLVEIGPWLAELHQLARPQFRDAALRLKVLSSSSQLPTDGDLVGLCCGLIQEVEAEKSRPFALLEDLFFERYIAWQPSLLERLEGEGFRSAVCQAVMQRAGIGIRAPGAVAWERARPLNLSWEGFELDLASRTLLTDMHIPVHHLVELAKERGRALGVPVGQLQQTAKNSYESAKFCMVISENREVLFYRKQAGCRYKHVEARALPGGDVGRHLASGMLWLEETPKEHKKLLVHKPTDVEIWMVTLSDDSTVVKVREQLLPEQLIPLNLDQWLESLSPLAGFCALSKISCYTGIEGKLVKRIVFDVGAVPLVFEVRASKKQPRAFGTGEHAGFWIAHEQQHPSLEGLGGYLLIENSHSQKVILAGNQWAAMGLWRGLAKLEVAPFLRRWMTDIAIQSQHTSVAHVFELIDGQLIADDPLSQTYLLFLYLGLGRQELADQVSERLERLFYESEQPVSHEFIDGLFPLCLILPKIDKRASRVRRKLFAAAEMHLARFQKPKVSPSDNPTLSKIYYLLLITSTFNDLLSIAKSHEQLRQINEEQEYFLYLRLLRLVKELQLNSSGEVSESLTDWGTEILQGLIFSSDKGPELIQRYRALRQQFGVKDSTTALLAKKCKDIWYAPTEQVDSITINIGKKLFDPLAVSKKAVQVSIKAAMTSMAAELKYGELVLQMCPSFMAEVPLTFGELSAEAFIYYFLTYYKWAYDRDRRLEKVLSEGGWGGQTRILMNYLLCLRSMWKVAGRSFGGLVPSPEELQQALCGVSCLEQAQSSSSSSSQARPQQEEALRAIFSRLEAIFKRTEVSTSMLATGASWAGAAAVNSFFNMGLGLWGPLAQAGEKVVGGLLNLSKPGTSLDALPAIKLAEDTLTKFRYDDDYMDKLLQSFLKQTFKPDEASSLMVLSHGLDSCIELLIDLKRLHQLLQAGLDQERGGLLHFLNAHPSMRGEKITFLELCHLLAQGDFGPLRGLIPTISAEELHCVEMTLVRYLLRYTRFLQVKRILSHTQNLLKEPSQAEAEKLLHELRASRAYNPDTVPLLFLRPIVLFEATMNTLVWPKQFERISEVVFTLHKASKTGKKGALLEALPGTGKTFVTGPLVMKIRSTGRRLLCMASPPQFAATNVARIGEIHRLVWGQNSHVVTFARAKPLSHEQLAALDVQFQTMSRRGQLLHMTQAHAQGLYLQTVSLIYRSSQRPHSISARDNQQFLGLKRLQQRLREEGELHGEEAHEQFYFLKQLCYPEGASSTIPDSHAWMVGQAVQLLYKICGGISVAGLRYLTEDTYKKEVLPKLAQACAALPYWGKLKRTEKQELEEYLCEIRAAPPNWMEQRSDFDNICMLSLVISRYLPSCACERLVDTDFGLGKDHSAGPNLGNRKPDLNSTIKDPIERLVKTYLLYYVNGLSKEHLLELVQDLYSQAKKESQHAPLGEQLARQRWQTLLPDFSLDDFSMAKAKNHDWLSQQKNSTLIDYYVRRFAVPEIYYYSTSSFANPYNWASMFQQQLHTTGTLYNGPLCDSRLEILSDPETVQVTKRIFAQKVRSILPLAEATPLEILYEELESYFQPGSDYTAIVDGASLFTGLSSLEVAEAMLAHASNRGDIKAVVFCITDKHGADHWVYISKKNQIPLPLERCPYPPVQRYTYFDEPHCYSSDIAVEGCAVVNISKHTKYFELVQWMLRLRGIKNWNHVLTEFAGCDRQQSVCLAAPKTDFFAIFGEDKLKGSVDALYAHIAEEERKSLLELALPSYQLQLADIICRNVRDKYLQAENLDEAAQYFAPYASFFVTKQNFDPIELRNRRQVKADSSKIVQSLKSKAKESLNFGYLEDKEREAIGQQIDDLPVPNMPAKTKAYESSTGELFFETTDQSQTIELTEEQQLDLQQEMEEQIQAHLQAEYANSYEEIAWPDSMLALDDSLRFDDPKAPRIASNSVFKPLWSSFRLQSADKQNAIPPPIYPLRSVLQTFASPSLQAIHQAFDKRLWVTNNWLPTSVRAEAGTSAQRALQDVLVRFDASAKVVWMGCLSESDSAAWVKKLETHPSDSLAVYSTTARQIRAGKQVPRKQLKHDADFVMLETQLLFLSGKNFTPKQQRLLHAWMIEHGPSIMKDAYMNIFNARNRDGVFTQTHVASMFL